jgi:hypothetical protein
MEEEVEEFLHSDKEKNLNKDDHNIQDLWDMSKRLNLQICDMEERTKIQTTVIESLFSESTAENPQI